MDTNFNSDTSISLNCEDDLPDMNELQNVELDLKHKNDRDDQEFQAECEKSLHEIGAKESYRRLQVLLDKSNIYAELILSRMKQEQEKAMRSSKRDTNNVRLLNYCSTIRLYNLRKCSH